MIMNVTDIEKCASHFHHKAMEWSGRYKCSLLSRSCCVFVYVRDSCFVAHYVTLLNSKLKAQIIFPRKRIPIFAFVYPCVRAACVSLVPIYPSMLLQFLLSKGNYKIINKVIIIVHHLLQTAHSLSSIKRR